MARYDTVKRLDTNLEKDENEPLTHYHLVSQRFFDAMKAHNHLSFSNVTYISKHVLWGDVLHMNDVLWQQPAQATGSLHLAQCVEHSVMV